ncbi:preprotein translocase subunit SecA [Helicovermis profundi]|uniref:Protein translocase subunit SecA n=1 Tax=Helicovermis profundi TaxID=3065157 RepID=A0AAU9E0Y6_9FIRM|nr:preprotein translocase subunit SecA [Clostridia bacterium S502]
MGIVSKIISGFNDREIKKLFKTVDKIEKYDQLMQNLSDEELKDKTIEFKDRVKKGESLDDLLPEAFAVVREAAVRTLGLKHYRVQLLGGVVLHNGRIAEMKTGEGKTLMATLAAYLNSLDGKGVHVITVNDYLAKRDKEWMGKVYNFLGLTVACVIHEVQGEERKAAYRADITYGTNNEFGFDYLRDNMVLYKENKNQRELNYAIIDEVDSILVDEARTPLIISGEGAKSTDLYTLADNFARTLKNEIDYTMDEKAKSVVLTDESGFEKAEKFFGVTNLSDPENMEIQHHVNQALKARVMMKRDVDYVVKDGEVLIVDEMTGRIMLGRRYSNGLHQAIEAKEGLKVRKESQTLSTITLQNYFRMYNKLSGMTGTAKTEEEEFLHIYNMDVVEVPTNKPIIRVDKPDVIFKSASGKYKAVIEDIIEKHSTGQPVLVGTISIETSEYLSGLLKKRGIKHEVLNAKQHEREAEIVSQAGRFNSVTIATNMAGRGTDIVLGGNPDFMTVKDMLKMGYDEEIINLATSPLEYDDEKIHEARSTYNKILKEHKEITDKEAEKVKSIGGLHIIGTERHESRRIDNQLRGRAGRQGDNGSTQFYISFDDELMRIFVSDKIKAMVEKIGMDDETPIEANILSKSIEGAQKKVEGRNFGIRKHVLQYDDVMNKQRTIIYNERAKVLEGEDVKDLITGMIEEIVKKTVVLYTAEAKYPEDWDLKGITDHLHQFFLAKDYFDGIDILDMTTEELEKKLLEYAFNKYEEKEEEVTSERMRELERYVLLKIVDSKWIDHIDAMEQLKQGIGLRAVGNEDPVRAYQFEGFDMFNEMTENIQSDTVRLLYNVNVETDTTRKKVAVITNEGPVETKKPVKRGVKIGRNDPCPCGSGKKYKKCCGANITY